MTTLQEGLQAPVDIVKAYKSQGVDVALEVACSQQAFEGSAHLGYDSPGEGFLQKIQASEAPIVYVGGHQVCMTSYLKEVHYLGRIWTGQCCADVSESIGSSLSLLP